MNKEYYKAKIGYMAQNDIKNIETQQIYNNEIITSKTLNELIENICNELYITKKQIKKAIKKENNKIYRDDKNNNSREIGFIINLGWELPYKENKKVFESRIIEITKINEQIINLKDVE